MLVILKLWAVYTGLSYEINKVFIISELTWKILFPKLLTYHNAVYNYTAL